MSTVAQQEAPIVVGFDLSEGSVVALRWAADEAERRSVPLRVVQAWTSGEFGTDSDKGRYTQEQLTKTVAGIMDGRDVDWSARTEMGSAARVLLAQAEDAQMLVVGSRGHGTLAGLALGSVGIQVATHDGAAVVVIVRDQER